MDLQNEVRAHTRLEVREESKWSYEDLVNLLLTAGMVSTAWWLIYQRYCVWRHEKYPYAERQVRLRQKYFYSEFPAMQLHVRSRRCTFTYGSPQKLFLIFLALSMVNSVLILAAKRM